ncbi:MAG: hybrid sensor histidine kinase/response regulator [Nitrospinota bacterium]|nr:hybrid sensor histidine kinase/response regulator [Nitrospinota bacterium]
MKFEEAIVDEFVAEAKEHLSSIEGDLLSLEKTSGKPDQDLVNKVFRAIHTVKGSAGFLGFVKLAELAHVMETLLSLIRSGEVRPNSEVVDPLLKGVDIISTMLGDINNSNKMVIAGLVDNIGAHIMRGSPAEEPDPDQANAASRPHRAPPIDDASLQNLFNEARTKQKAKEKEKESPVSVTTMEAGEYSFPEMLMKEVPDSCKFIYLLRYDLTELAGAAGKTPTTLMKELNEAGKILDTNIKFTVEDLREGLPKKPLFCDVVYATSIERELVKGVTGLSEASIVELKIPTESASKNKSTTEPATRPAGLKLDQTLRMDDLADMTDLADLADLDELEESLLQENTVEPKMEKPAKTRTQEVRAPMPSLEPPKDEHDDPILGITRSGKDQSETIRLNVSVIDKLMTLAGELVLVRNQQIRSVDKSDPVSRAIAQRLDVVTTEIQESIMSTRMQPIGNIFNKFPRIIRELNRQLSKKIEMDIQGADVELDKTILEALADPLTHLVRNSCDHGIESPEERRLKGKPETGHIQLNAYHEGGQINIVIKDDGRGVNLQKVKSRAIAHGIKNADELSAMSDKEILYLTAQAGFSTAEKVTDMSGRGVGLDVVKTSVEDLGGTFDIDSVENEGVTMHLTLPLTLAIIPCLIVQMGDNRYAIPQVNVEELVCLYDEDVDTKIEVAGDREVYRLRNKLLSMVRLDKALEDELRSVAGSEGGKDTSAPDEGTQAESIKGRSMNFGVLKAGANRFGLIIDKIIGTEEIVVKPMHPAVKDIGCYSGATVMGDGKVALILDVQGIAREAGISTDSRGDEGEEDSSAETETDTHTVLLFEYGKDEQFAIALSLIKRIEHISMKSVEKLGGDRFITIDGVSTQLITLSKLMKVSECEEEEEMFMLLPKHASRPVGLLIHKLLDTEEAPSVLNEESYMEDGMMGTAILRNRLTLFPDVYRLVDMSENKWLLEERLRKESMIKGSRLPRILSVVEDPFMKVLVRRYLHSEGYEVAGASTAEEALGRVNDEQFDAMVCDVAAMGQQGLDLIMAVRSGDRQNDIPAVALVSAEKLEKERAAAQGAGYSRVEIKLEKDGFLLAMAEMLNKALIGQSMEENDDE